MPIQHFVVGPMGNNTYVVYDDRSKQAAVVDPGSGSNKALDWALEQGLSVRYVLNTHGHTDHTYNDGYFAQKTEAKLYIHQADEPMLAQLGQGRGWASKALPAPIPAGYLSHGQEFVLGGLRLTVIATPGHTPGSVCFLVDHQVMTGDTLFQGSIGRFDFPGGSLRDLMASIKEKLFVLPAETVVLPGHGPFSRIGEEQENNPFVGREPRVDLSRYVHKEGP